MSWYCSAMMKRATLAIADIYVPVKRRATLDQKRVEEVAASILDKGLETPIHVRADGARFVLAEGLHRLEAAKRLRFRIRLPLEPVISGTPATS
jgi:sulfiredoxin